MRAPPFRRICLLIYLISRVCLSSLPAARRRRRRRARRIYSEPVYRIRGGLYIIKARGAAVKTLINHTIILFYERL